jgi:GMP synthase-like glutamine amidotransferase
MQLSDIGKQLFGDHLDSLTIQQMHRDHVPSAPSSSFHILASTPLTPNQGMVRFLPSIPQSTPLPSHTATLPPIQILTLQGHPEFTESIVSSIVEQRAASGVIDAEAAKDSERRRFWKTDSLDVIGKVIWGAMLQARRH